MAYPTTPPPFEVLSGHGVTLEPYRDDHLPGLTAALAHREVFAGGWGGGPAGFREGEDFARWLPEYLPIGRGHPYVVRDARGEVVGTSSLTDFSPILQYAHLGWTAYAPEHWGAGVNAACKLLLLGHVFAHGYGRVKLQADMLNERSRAAMASIGAHFEGVVRREQPRSDGSWRDTAQFSVTVDDWPEVRAVLERRVARGRS
ncbi:GNAT family N-acetyltransferase [Microcella indica]|uniref:GNAT family N-acetyltransferase n=1 Tax=Microcella indica TaxID=2750620 RepID=UPI0015CF1E66|nr:GNAT family protein [Microcella indica]